MPLEPYTPHSRSSRRSSPALAANVVEVWHVAVSWDDIKMMTVDQLDDAFRLDIVDASTSVWKEGMDEWLPLGVIAGIDAADEDDEEEISQVEVVWPMASALPQVPRLPAPSPAPVLRAVPAPAPALRPLPAPASRAAPVPALKATVPGPAASLRPAPRAVSSLPPAPVLVATQSSWPPAAAPLSRAQQPWAGDYRAPAPDDWATPRGELRPERDRPTAPPASARFARDTDAPPSGRVPGQSVAPSGPVAFTIPPARARRSGGSRFGQWLLGVAFIGGVLVTLYRNDILLDAARSLHVESRYLDAERTLLGGPSFGTPRALDAFRETAPVAAAGAGLDVKSTTGSFADRPALVEAPAPAPAAEAPPPVEATHAKEVTSLSALPVDTASAVHAAAAPAPAAPLAKAAAAQALAPSSKHPSSRSGESSAPQATHAQRAVATSKASDEESRPSKAAARESESHTKSASASHASGETVGMPKSSLMDAIGEAAKRKTPKGKNAQYDPLNGEL